MDLYRGLYDFVNFSTQVHDFDTGIHPYPSGLFWTSPIAAQQQVNLGIGTARMQVDNLALQDFFSIPNALFRFQAPAAATCSFDIHWTGPVASRGRVTSPAGSAGELVMTQATMTWSASNELGFRFVSNPSPTTSVFAQLGKVRNGVFAD